MRSFLQQNRMRLAILAVALAFVAYGLVVGALSPLEAPLLAMAASLPTRGRAMGVKRGAASGSAVLVAAVRTKSIKVNGEPIDITSDDDVGWKTLLTDIPGEMSVEISVAGVLKDEVLATEAISTTDRSKYTEFNWPGASSAGKFSGEFFLSSFGINGEYKGEATFEATFTSSGAIAFTAAV